MAGVRGIGSAAFIAGVLVAGQSAAVWGRDYVRISPRPMPRPCCVFLYRCPNTG